MAGAIEKANMVQAALLEGDLGKLTPTQRVDHYMAVCQSLGVNPMTKPFEYTYLNGKTILYVSKGATDQLRKINNISIEIVSKTQEADLYIVEVKASTPDGRTDTEVGIVDIAGKRGEALANAMMKCITKAKRRATLSVCGLGMLDDSEVESAGAQRLIANLDTGELKGPALPARKERVMPEATAKIAEPAQPQADVLQTTPITAPGLAAISASDKERILAAAKREGWTKDKVRKLLTAQGYKVLDDIPADMVDSFISLIGDKDADSGTDSAVSEELFQS